MKTTNRSLLLSRFTRRSALVGGGGLIVHYGLHLLHGLQTGRVLWDDMTSPLGRIDGILFTAAFVAIDCALLALFTRLKRVKQGPGGLLFAGAFFSLLAMTAEMAGLISFLANHFLQPAMAIGCLSMFVSALLLGIAGLLPQRSMTSDSLPRPVTVWMILFALTTAPLGFAFETLTGIVPAYTVIEVHFVVAGLIWLAIGRAVHQETISAGDWFQLAAAS